ncbi:MAG TPA: SDR family oxidoreductase [Steroidobacteraceae bacterium]|nr:SDR family oxidoreductase [Steroidobacteraceae bacterium]
MSILVTGARGFIGRALCRHLTDQGVRVCGLGHGDVPAGELESSGLACWRQGEVDFANLDGLAAAQGPFSAVVHLAGGSTVGASIRAPLEDFNRTCGTSVQLLDWIRARSPHTAVLVISSAAVYGGGHSGPIREDAATSPASPYGTHKLVMELLCRSYVRNFGIKAAILRLFSVYGEGLKKQLLWDLCAALARDGSALLAGSGEEMRDWIHVSDAAELIRMVVAKASIECPIFNGGTGRCSKVAEIAAYVAGCWSSAAQVRFSGERRPGDPRCLLADPTRATDIGFHPRIELHTGLLRYVQWFRETTS